MQATATIKMGSTPLTTNMEPEHTLLEKEKHLQRTFFFGGGSMAFFGVYPEHHDCMDFTVDIEQGIFQQLLKD